METGIELIAPIHNLFWLIGHAAEGSEFITSDNPLVEEPSGELVTFPVAVDTALMMMPAKAGRVHNYDKETPADIVHLTNLAIAKASERLVLGRDEAYLRRVVSEAGIEGVAPSPLIDIGPPLP